MSAFKWIMLCLGIIGFGIVFYIAKGYSDRRELESSGISHKLRPISAASLLGKTAAEIDAVLGTPSAIRDKDQIAANTNGKIVPEYDQERQYDGIGVWLNGGKSRGVVYECGASNLKIKEAITSIGLTVPADPPTTNSNPYYREWRDTTSAGMSLGHISVHGMIDEDGIVDEIVVSLDHWGEKH